MHRSKADLLQLLLARVALTDGTVFVSADQLERWPTAGAEELKRAGLLQSAGDVDWIECRRCIRRCARPVERCPNPLSSAAPRFQTTCDLRDDVSVVPVRPERLKRWRTGRARFAQFVGSQMGLRVRDGDYETGRISYQATRIGGVRLSVALVFVAGRAELHLGNDGRPLIELIIWNRGPPRLNISEVQLWAAEIDASRATPIGTPASRLKQVRRKARSASRNDRWQAEADALKRADPHRKKSDIADEIFRSQRWHGVNSSKTIERLIRLPK